MIVADYSQGFPGARHLKAAGFGGAVRYIGSPGNIKCTTAEELADFTREDLGMALVFEQTAGQWRGGYEQGRRDALAARHHASAVGFPLHRPIYFAIDQDVVTEDEFKAMDAYADGWASVLGHELCGPYGEYDVVRRCWDRGFRWAWQCRAWSGVPTPRMFDERHLFQRVGTVTVNGIPCDINDVNKADWGQHTGGTDVELSTRVPIYPAPERWGEGVTDVEYGTLLRWSESQLGLVGERVTAQQEELAAVRSELAAARAEIAELKTSGVPVDVKLSETDRAALASQMADLLAERLKS